jgi:hypothetical protein
MGPRTLDHRAQKWRSFYWARRWQFKPISLANIANAKVLLIVNLVRV